MIEPGLYVSFMLRLWREGGQEPSESNTEWQGEVEHIQSGRRWAFTTMGELLRFVEGNTEELAALDGSASRGNAIPHAWAQDSGE